jgi:dihydrofolate reductase
MGFTTRWGFTSVVYNNALWVIAGYSGNERNDVWYSTDGATWVAATNSAEFPGRHRHESIVFDNKMWVLAGYPNLCDAWYTSNGSQWIAATVNGVGGVAEGFSVLNYNGKIWKIAGGRGDESNQVFSSADGVTWTQVTSQAAFEKRGYHASIVFNNKMWVIGGETPVTTINDKVMGGKQNDVWNSTDGINWNLVTSHAAFKPRSYHACVVFRNMIWVIGGENDTGSSSDIWTSHDGLNWTLKTANAGFSPRYFHKAVVMDDKLYIIGGTGSTTTSDDVWVLE